MRLYVTLFCFYLFSGGILFQLVQQRECRLPLGLQQEGYYFLWRRYPRFGPIHYHGRYSSVAWLPHLQQIYLIQHLKDSHTQEILVSLKQKDIFFFRYVFIENYLRKPCSTDDLWGRRGRDRMVLRFTTTYAVGAYHH